MTLNELMQLQGAATWDPNAYSDPQAGGGLWQPQVGPGWMLGLQNLPGQNFYSPDVAEGNWDMRLLRDYLQSNNLTAAEGAMGDNRYMRGVFDREGNPVIPVEEYQYDGDQAFWNGAMLALGVTGANIGLANGAFGGAAAGGGNVGTLGTIPAGSGAVAPLSTAGTGTLSTGAVTGGLSGGAAGGAAAGTAAASSMPSWLGPAINAGVGLIGQNSAIRAADRASDAQINLLREMNAQNRADNQPLLNLRNSVLPQINALMQNPSSLSQQPDYQFGLNEGSRQIANRQAASGNYYSGGALREAQRFGQDYAGSRLDQSLNRLMGVAGLGQVGGNNQQQANTNFGNVAGNALMNQGANRASGYMGMTNNVGGAVNDWFNNWQRNALGGP